MLGTTVNVVHEARCPDIGPVCDTRDEPPQIHDQQFWLAELRLLADYAVLDWLSVELQFPLRLSSTSIIYRRLDGTPFVPETPDIHHRDETLWGLGDPWLSARARFSPGQWQLAGRLGFTVPVGRTEENPFALGRLGLRHQHVQFGTGTVDPLLGLEAERAFEPFVARAYVQALLTLYTNQHGYQAGSRLAGGVGFGWKPLPSLELSVTFDALTEWPERWDGVVEQDGNLGRTDLLLGGAVRWTVERTTLILSARSPVYQHIITTQHDAGQLTYPVVLLLGVQRPFSFGP